MATFCVSRFKLATTRTTEKLTQDLAWWLDGRGIWNCLGVILGNMEGMRFNDNRKCRFWF